MYYTPLLFPLFFILLVVLLPFLLIQSLFLWRERRTARVAGMSDATPICGQCHYRLSGWTTSNCPECGADARKIGVRIGPRTGRVRWTGGLLLLSLAVVFPLFGFITSWIFTYSQSQVSTLYSSETVPNLLVTIEASTKWKRFLSRSTYRVTMEAHWFPRGVAGYSWDHGNGLRSPAKRRSQIITWDQESGIPPMTDFESLFRTLDAEEFNEEEIRTHTLALVELSSKLSIPGSQSLPDWSALDRWSTAPLVNAGNGWNAGRGNSKIWFLFALVAAAIAMGFSIWLPARFSRSGWRDVREGEWTTV